MRRDWCWERANLFEVSIYFDRMAEGRLGRVTALRRGDMLVDFYTASLGHDICARHPWVQGKVGSRYHGAAMHPLAAGQHALARIIESRLRRPPPG